MDHPYRSLPPASFWARSISTNWDPLSLKRTPPLIRKEDKVISLGSCFASNMIRYLRESNLTYLEEEQRPAAFASLPEDNFSYHKFSAAYGNIYTVRQFLQLLKRTQGTFSPIEDRWITSDSVIDPFRPGLKYKARTIEEFDALTSYHLAAVNRAFEKASVVIFTLGLTEAWISNVDGAVFPACPGTVAGTFDDKKHVFHNFSFNEIVTDLEHIIDIFDRYTVRKKLILTVSPVPLVATATTSSVLEATTYSKSVLRAACGEISNRFENVSYFPAYEIITGPQAPAIFYETDRRNVSDDGINEVMTVFLASCETDGTLQTASTNLPTADNLSVKLAEVECEEAASAT